ncbi:MAG: DNA-directed RNA polymerase subunit omega [Clostridia bacterium]|nr:DNA-directed RNA polymerase subunit omega [Clostridia bacterium]
MMLYPTLESLVNIIGNRYLLVNVTAKRAREIANAAAENGEKLEYKPVRLAVQ